MVCKDLEGTSHNIFQGPIPAFTWTDWGKPQPISVKIASNMNKIQTGYLPNTSLQCYCFANLTGFLVWQKGLSTCHNAKYSFIQLKLNITLKTNLYNNQQLLWTVVLLHAITTVPLLTCSPTGWTVTTVTSFLTAMLSTAQLVVARERTYMILINATKLVAFVLSTWPFLEQ